MSFRNGPAVISFLCPVEGGQGSVCVCGRGQGVWRAGARADVHFTGQLPGSLVA